MNNNFNFKKNILCLLILFLNALLINAQSFADPFSHNTGKFLYDNGINHFYLYESKCVTDKLGKNVWEKHMFEVKGELPKIECVSKDKSEILRLFFHYGGTKNEPAGFQILKTPKGYKLNKKVIQSNSDKYRSALGIYLGITKAQVVKKIGAKFNQQKDKYGNMVLTYYTNNENDVVFKEYAGVGYKITCVFKNDKLVDYSFGFEYP